MNTLGLYVHIPFCKSKCAYCDFYSLPDKLSLVPTYVSALKTQLEEAAAKAANFAVDTVYFGGGTPLMVGAEGLVTLLETVFRSYTLSPAAEITVEANPDSVTAASLKRLREAGFNRLSMGMQSANDAELAAVGRPHTFAQTVEAVRMAREAGFDNVSLDLIYGLPGQTLSSWQTSVDAALALAPDHLSCYGLKVEAGTPLARRVAAGEVLPDDDAQADCYLWAVERLREAGIAQYEISNFARPGRESRHNLKYWRLEPYLGFGPGAHSDFGGRRYAYRRDLAQFLADGPVLEEDSPISPQERRREYVMLGLRTADGLSPALLKDRFGTDFAPLEPLFQQMASQGWAIWDAGRWRFTPEGFLRSNALIGLVLEELEPTL